MGRLSRRKLYQSEWRVMRPAGYANRVIFKNYTSLTLKRRQSQADAND